jgi:hypothetical protein
MYHYERPASKWARVYIIELSLGTHAAWIKSANCVLAAHAYLARVYMATPVIVIVWHVRSPTGVGGKVDCGLVCDSGQLWHSH